MFIQAEPGPPAPRNGGRTGLAAPADRSGRQNQRQYADKWQITKTKTSTGRQFNGGWPDQWVILTGIDQDGQRSFPSHGPEGHWLDGRGGCTELRSAASLPTGRNGPRRKKRLRADHDRRGGEVVAGKIKKVAIRTQSVAPGGSFGKNR